MEKIKQLMIVVHILLLCTVTSLIADALDDIYDQDFYIKSILNFSDGATEMPEVSYGQGVNVCTVESGIRQSYIDKLVQEKATEGITLRIEEIHDNPESSDHSETMFHALVNIAPKANIYHFKFGNATEDIANFKRCNIETVSQSTTDSYHYQYDELLYTDTPIVYCAPTANEGLYLQPNDRDEVYHGISVGGAAFTEDYHEIPIESVYEYTQLINKWKTRKRYAFTQTANKLGDKEVPHVVATSSTSWVEGPKDALDNGGGYAGTSSASPSVNGVCAAVISSNEALMKKQPLNVKVAVMVTAENIDGGYWNPAEDGRDGCGVVSGYNACMYAINLGDQLKTASSPASDIGLAAGKLQNDPALEGTVLSFNVKAPDVLPRGKHLRAVLTWSRGIPKSGNALYLNNLNLELRDKSNNEIIARCASDSDNIEVIDVENKDLVPGKNYSLIIRIDDMNIVPDSLYDHTKYSIGWVWVNDFAGKEIKGKAITEDDESILRDRTLHIGGAETETVFGTGLVKTVSADNKIIIKPGTKFERGSTITLSTTNHFGRYFNASTSTDDKTGYKNDLRRLIGRVEGDYNRFLFHDDGTLFKDAQLSYEMQNIETIKKNGLNKGFTFSGWMQFKKEITDSDGDLVTFVDKNGRVVLNIDILDFGQTNKRISFNLTDENGNSDSLSYTLDEKDLEDHDAQGKPRRMYIQSWGWVFVTAMYKPGKEMKLYVNDRLVQKNTTLTTIAVDKGYIGTNGLDPAKTFHGTIDDFRFYDGVITDKHRLGLYSAFSFLDGYGGELNHVTIKNGDKSVLTITIPEESRLWEDQNVPYEVQREGEQKFKLFRIGSGRISMINIDAQIDEGWEAVLTWVDRRGTTQEQTLPVTDFKATGITYTVEYKEIP